MKKIIMIVAVGIVILLVVAGFAGLLPLGVLDEGEYHTGFSNSVVNNCETKHYKKGCFLDGCWYGNILKDYSELIFSPHNNAPIVTSMSRGMGERSIEVVAHGNLAYDSSVGHWTPEYGWYEVAIKYSPTGGWNTIINTKDNQVDPIVAFVSGSTSKQKYYDRSGPVIIPGLTFSTIKTLNPIGFCLKGPHVGILRVQQKTEFSASLGLQKETHTTSEDYAFLISGKGNVELAGSQTRYIEGIDTVKFRVDTGYSGYTMGGEYVNRGWELKVYDNYGDLKKTWLINDDKQGTRYDKNGDLLDYAIPSGSFNPTGSNMWTAVLTNTLFNQDDETFFAISQEALQQAPGIKSIEFGEDEYNMGNAVTIHLEGIPNPEGRNKIDGFIVNILYGTDGTDYVENYHQRYVSSSGDSTTISFRASKGDTYVTVEAWAFDAPESQGGIMSEKETSQVWIKDKEHKPVEVDWLPLVFAVITFVIFLVVGLLVPVPWQIKIIIIVVGSIVAYLVYLFFPSL